MKKNKPKHSSLSNFFAVATAKQNQTLNEKSDWGYKWLSLGHKNIYQPILAGKGQIYLTFFNLIFQIIFLSLGRIKCKCT